MRMSTTDGFLLVQRLLSCYLKSYSYITNLLWVEKKKWSSQLSRRNHDWLWPHPCIVSCTRVSRHSYSWLLLLLFTMSMEKSKEAWPGGDAFITGFTQKSVAIAFVPPSFVCVSWGGLKVGDASRWWGEELLRIHWPDLDERAVWAYVELYAYSSPRTNNQLEGWHNCMKHNCMNKTTSISEKNIWEFTRQSGLKEDLNGILMYSASIATLFTGFLLLSQLSLISASL